MFKLQGRDRSDLLTYSNMGKIVREEEALIIVKPQKSEMTKGHNQGAAAYITQACISAETERP